jgi:hypothetical protein
MCGPTCIVWANLTPISLKCPWGGDWAPPAFEKPDGGCDDFLYETSRCADTASLAACTACVTKEGNASAFKTAGCTAAKGEVRLLVLCVYWLHIL